MSGPVGLRLEGTVLTDLSANVFAALLLILLILLQAETAPEVPPRPIEATAELGARSRTPLSAAGLVAILYDRRPDADGISLDLTESGLRIGDRSADPAGALDGALRAEGGPLRLYVFTNVGYAAVADALTRSDRRWHEISVPRALRGPDGGWSGAFLALLARRPGLAQFRADLARLLSAAPGPLVPDGRAGGRAGGGGTDPAAPGASVLERLAHGLRIGITVAAILGGLGAVVAIELIVPPGRPRYGGAGLRQDATPVGTRTGP